MASLKEGRFLRIMILASGRGSEPTGSEHRAELSIYKYEIRSLVAASSC